MQKFSTLLMFESKAEEAMNFYTSIFKDSKIITITRYGENEPGAKGSVKYATFLLGGVEFMAIDSNVKQPFTFTPSISIYVKCETILEIDTIFIKLSDGGQILMPLDKYDFSQRFGWVADKFGVSWQLSLTEQ
jgi:predicted 3-demethylubiquinone-9 3-methyltransferase (glyoxalase superfamily)